MPLCWVFAYGSNMDVADLERWCRERGRPPGRIERVVPALLPSYRLVWNYYSEVRQGGAANVEPAAGHQLPGVALRVCPTMLESIDKKEGHPHRYARGSEPLPVMLQSGEEVPAWVYAVTPAYLSPEPVLPRPEYLAIVLRAAEEHDLPDWHLAELRSLLSRR